MQVSTITVNPDHVQGSKISNLVFLCVCLFNFFTSYEAASGQLCNGNVRVFLSMWRVKFLSAPTLCARHLSVNFTLAFVLLILRDSFPFLFYIVYLFLWTYVGPAFILMMRYHVSIGFFYDSPVFAFYHTHLQLWHSLLVVFFQFSSLCHGDYQGFFMSFIVTAMNTSFVSYDFILSARTLENSVISPGDMNIMIQFGNILQMALFPTGFLVLVSPGLFLSSFFIKLTVCDFVYNTQTVRDRVLAFGHVWHSHVHMVRLFGDLVCDLFPAHPELFSAPVIVANVLPRVSRDDLITEGCRRLTNVADDDSVQRLVAAIGMYPVMKALKLERYVIQCGDDCWFTPVAAARECTVSELLLYVEEKDVDLLCVRHLVQRRFPGGYLRDFEDLKDVLVTAREFATVAEILAVVTDECLTDSVCITDEELLHFLMNFLQYLSYETRLNFLSLYSPNDPAVAGILGCHFRCLDPVSQQLFAAEVFRMFTIYRPEWATSTLGRFQGAWLLEDSRPDCVAARIAGGEIE